MTRPCYLVVDREHAGSISTRKLVLETAKLNVITAFSGQEAIETFERFPAVDGVILDVGLEDVPCAEVVRTMKRQRPTLPVVVIGTLHGSICDGADHALNSFEPVRLLALLSQLNAQITAIQANEEAEQQQQSGDGAR